MAIKFFSDKIQIGDYNLFEGNGGIQFDGVARAENFVSVETSPTQGSVSGFTASGINDPTIINSIQKFPFAIDSNGSDVGDLTQTRRNTAGACSSTHGYAAGGLYTPTPPSLNTIDKFLFSTNTNASNVGDITAGKDNHTGLSSTISGYTSGGRTYPSTTPLNTIDKFPFASDANATDVGDLSQARLPSASASSPVFGYTIGGYIPPQSPTNWNTIDKFSFNTDSNATDVGDVAGSGRNGLAGLSSYTNGYVLGGEIFPGAKVPDINKFPFATDTNATDTTDLTVAGQQIQTSASLTHGYGVGGDRPAVSPVGANTIDKFLFATDANATDVGDLVQAVRSGNAGAISF